MGNIFSLRRVIFSILSITGIVVGVTLGNISEIISNCRIFSCFDIEEIGQAIALFSLAMFFLSFIFYFIGYEIFHSWWKFARIFLSISALIIITTPSSGYFLDPFGDKESVTWLLAILFFLFSITFIIYKIIRSRFRDKKEGE